MKTYKKGISLIVLVITVIVLAILATTVIISLSNTNIISEAKDAVQKNNLKAYEEQANLAYASWKMDNKSANLTNIADLEEYGFKASELPAGYIAYVTNGVPKITTGSVWDGNYPTDTTTFILEGEGTEASPYLINSASDFAFFAAYVNAGNNMQDKHIKLTTNIDLAGESWLPIGTYENKFFGNFDGNNKTIFNIYINDSEFDTSLYFDEDNINVGLFGIISEASISNFTLSGGDISSDVGYSYAGAFVGIAEASELHNLKNDNVAISATSPAGIAGWIWSSSVIENCENTGRVVSGGIACGIVNYLATGSSALNCVNRGFVSGNRAYGIAWHLGEGACVSMANCINYGHIHGKYEADAICNSDFLIDEEPEKTVSNSANYGKVTVDEGGTITNNANVNM